MYECTLYRASVCLKRRRGWQLHVRMSYNRTQVRWFVGHISPRLGHARNSMARRLRSTRCRPPSGTGNESLCAGPGAYFGTGRNELFTHAAPRRPIMLITGRRRRSTSTTPNCFLSQVHVANPEMIVFCTSRQTHLCPAYCHFA